jgi:hypothetical protein
VPTVDPAAVESWLGLPSGHDATTLTLACAAAEAMVNRLPWLAGVDPWPGDVNLAAIQLAGRLYRRRNTPSGVEPFGDVSAVYVARTDPDIARALRIGAHSMPAVG